jgi:hypothetical protein
VYEVCFQFVASFRGYQPDHLAFSLAETSGHLITKYTGHLKHTPPVHTLRLAVRNPSCLPCRIKRPKKAGSRSGIMGPVPCLAGAQCFPTLLHAEPLKPQHIRLSFGLIGLNDPRTAESARLQPSPSSRWLCYKSLDFPQLSKRSRCLGANLFMARERVLRRL